ncbi:MAG: hypothetical protein AB1938_00570 [Myxococcota bacterium]
MDRAFLEQLGLEVKEADGVVEAKLPLGEGQAFNPLAKTPIDAVSFTVMGDRLLYVGPPEFVGAQPINLAFITGATRLEDLVVKTLNDHLFQLERRSSELTAMGLHPKVDPATLQLTAELEAEPLKFVIGATRTGQFRVVRVFVDGTELTSPGADTSFELSEHRDRNALLEFLLAMFQELAEHATQTAPEPRRKRVLTPAPPSPEASVPFKELARAFGDAALPPRSTLEVLASVRVKGEELRFAAARVQGRTFRGLLAGSKGKVWADRFELDGFPGIRALVAQILKVPVEDVQVTP